MRSWELKGQSSYQRFPLFSLMSILYLCLYYDIRKKLDFGLLQPKGVIICNSVGRKSEILTI